VFEDRPTKRAGSLGVATHLLAQEELATQPFAPTGRDRERGLEQRHRKLEFRVSLTTAAGCPDIAARRRSDMTRSPPPRRNHRATRTLSIDVVHLGAQHAE